MNRLYFGDDLKWLSDRKESPDASVDLVYLDPPFNSNADYNVLFRELGGQASQAQFHAFTDTWKRFRCQRRQNPGCLSIEQTWKPILPVGMLFEMVVYLTCLYPNVLS